MITKQVWSDQRIQDRVNAKVKHYQAQGATPLAAEAIAYAVVCEEMRDEYEALLLKLNQKIAALEPSAAVEPDRRLSLFDFAETT